MLTEEPLVTLSQLELFEPCKQKGQDPGQTAEEDEPLGENGAEFFRLRRRFQGLGVDDDAVDAVAVVQRHLHVQVLQKIFQALHNLQSNWKIEF